MKRLNSYRPQLSGSAFGLFAVLTALSTAACHRDLSDDSSGPANENLALTNSGSSTLTAKFRFPNDHRQALAAPTGHALEGANFVTETDSFNRDITIVMKEGVPVASNPALISMSIGKVDGADAQSGKPSAVLTNPISVRITDQFGLGLRNQSVVFSVDAASGSVKRPTDTTFATSVTVVTDKDGNASVQWALGTGTGEQVLTVKCGSLSPITFKAISTNN